MDELKRTTDIVKAVLEEVPGTRNSDDFLYCKVCERISQIGINLPFWKVLMNRKDYGLPSFETVVRIRRKIQAKHPELCANLKVSSERLNREQVFIDYARGDI